ncbi:EamA family transporter [Candidatus Micrarchaeota archaeon]|nr:EamA family transporter [Candidatus Micrarchaeota archaeon]
MAELIPEWLVYALAASISIGFMNIANSNLSKQLEKNSFKIEAVLPLIAIIVLILAISYLGYYHKIISVQLLTALSIALFLGIVTLTLTLVAFSKGQTSLVSAVLLLNIIVTVVTSVIVFGESITQKQLAGIIVTTLGVFLLI